MTPTVPAPHRLATLAAALLAASVAPPRAVAEPPRAAVVFSGPALGARYTARVVMRPGDEAANERVRAALAREVALAERLFSPTDAGSEASRLEAHASTAPLPVSPETIALLEILEAARAAAGGRVEAPALVLDPRRGTVAKARAGATVDLPALARAWTADRLSAALGAHAHRDALVDVGGDVAARGLRADGSRWRVAVEAPEAGRVGVVVELDGVALSTRARTAAAGELASATVVHRQGAWAGALAAALLALGPDGGRALATRDALAARLVLRQGERAWAEWATPGFEALVVPAR